MCPANAAADAALAAMLALLLAPPAGAEGLSHSSFGSLLQLDH